MRSEGLANMKHERNKKLFMCKFEHFIQFLAKQSVFPYNLTISPIAVGKDDFAKQIWYITFNS